MIPGSLEGLDLDMKGIWQKYRGQMKTLSKHSFWGWIAYQTIKGTLTTTLIWVPLLCHHFMK